MTTISSTTSSTSSTYSRVTGLASGLDTDSIVEELMTAERVPLDQLEQEQQVLEWQQEDYQDLNDVMSEFETTASTMRLESTFNAKTASSSAESIVKATAGSNATEGTYTITVTSLASGVTKGSAGQLADEEDSSGNTLSLYAQFADEFEARGISSTDTISVTINGTSFEFDLDSDNIETMASEINSADIGVTANYDGNLNRFFLTTTDTGSAAEITVTSDSASFFSNGDTYNSVLGLSIDEDTTYNGTNASINYGDVTGIESSSNSITINGLSFTLTGKGESTVTVSSDVDSIVDTITEFVDAYNETLSTLYSKVQEERDYDYPALTDAQKEEMSDDEIEAWNEKAREGLLGNDSELQSLIDNMRSIMASIVTGTDSEYNSLSSIGISSSSWEDYGILTIDEDTLREALSSDLEAVEDLFTSTSTNDGTEGIGVKLYEATVDGVDYLTEKAEGDTSTIGEKLSDIDDDIDDWEDKLDEIEERYYSKFTTMETYISSMNSQSLWLSSMFSSS